MERREAEPAAGGEVVEAGGAVEDNAENDLPFITRLKQVTRGRFFVGIHV